MTSKKSEEYSDEEFEQIIQDGQRFQKLLQRCKVAPAGRAVLIAPLGTPEEVPQRVRDWLDTEWPVYDEAPGG